MFLSDCGVITCTLPWESDFGSLRVWREMQTSWWHVYTWLLPVIISVYNFSHILDCCWTAFDSSFDYVFWGGAAGRARQESSFGEWSGVVEWSGVEWSGVDWSGFGE